MIGRGIFSKMRNRMEKDCKDWYERQQKGGRRPVKKRKPKKQTGLENKRELGRNVNLENKREQARNVNLENKLEQARNPGNGLERKVNPENRRAMVCGQD